MERYQIGAAEHGRGLLVVGAREIATLAGGLRRGDAQGDVAALRDDAGDLALAVADGRIQAFGATGSVHRALTERGIDPDVLPVLDAAGGTITPGLVDPHTHLLFSGTREIEVSLRQRGAGYLEILAAGGGILSTVHATRAASEDALLAHGSRWLREMLAHGVTTVEAKSGYGLDVATELRLLEVAGRLGASGPVEVVPTFLGAHAVPAEFRDLPDAADHYIDAVVDEQLPAVASQRTARACDVFCEEGVFTVAQSRRVLVAARDLGLDVRLHADELRPSGGAELAAELGAASADHLSAISRAGVDSLARAAGSEQPVVAILLPATTLSLMSDHFAPARELIERGIPVALATDFNPGTSPTPNLPLVLSLACLELRLTPSEALVAATVNAAHALRLGATHGSLEPGKQADLVVWDVPRHELLPYWLGADLVRAVVKRGEVVHHGRTEEMPPA